MKRPIAACVTSLALISGLSACTNPYDPGQRFVGGGLFGAASGAAIGAAAGGGDGRGDRCGRRCIWRGRHHAPAIWLLLWISRLLRLLSVLTGGPADNRRYAAVTNKLLLNPQLSDVLRWCLRRIKFKKPIG